MKIVIIGGVAGGASAATRARRVDANAEIIIYEKGPYISFANCGLPYHLGGEIKERSKLLVASPEMFKDRFNIDVKTLHEVSSIDPEKKTLLVTCIETKTSYTETFDKLIISTGSSLIRIPNIPYEAENVFTLWSMNDLDEIKAYLSENKCKTVHIVGAGFVGLEIVEQLAHLEMEVHLIELAEQVLSPLDPEMAKFIEEELIENNIQLHLGTTIKSLSESEGRVKEITLSSGQTITSDCLIMGIGVRPFNTIAKDAGITLGESSAIQVNANQQTNFPDIYAVGDVSEYTYGPDNSPSFIPLAGPANRSGRIAGEHAASGQSQFEQKVYGTSILRVFKKVAGITGLSEKACTRKGIPFRKAYISATHHASYFPGAKNLIIKLLYSPEKGKLLGAQVVGEEGVDKRLDVVSTALHFGGTVKDLAALDLAYAPPFGSAKDPLHQAAFVALNDLDNSSPLLPPSSNLEGYQVIDVRTEEERKALPLEGSIHIPIDLGQSEILERVTSLSKEAPTVITCHSGKRAHIVTRLLKENGFKNIWNLTGGMMIRSRSKIVIG